MFLFCVAGLPSVSSLDDYDYSSDDYDTYYSDDNNYQDEKVVHTNPTFLSDPTNQLINEGETIKLPCLVDKLGKAFFFAAATSTFPKFVVLGLLFCTDYTETGTLFQHQSFYDRCYK